MTHAYKRKGTGMEEEEWTRKKKVLRHKADRNTLAEEIKKKMSHFRRDRGIQIWELNES